MSKDLKPKHWIGQTAGSRRRRVITWIVILLAGGGGVFAAYRYAGTTTVEVPVTRVRRGEFIISVKTRGEIRSTRSVILSAPQVPNPRIVRLAESGKPIKKGEVVVEFDTAQQEQSYSKRTTNVRTVDSDIVQTKASHQIIDEMDGMNLMTSDYNLQRAKLEASKAEILSEIEGAKNRIDVGISRRRAGAGEDHDQVARRHAAGRPGASDPAQGQDAPRHGARTRATCPRWWSALPTTAS